MGGERISIVVNGEPREVAVGDSVADFLASIGRDPRTVAVELNGDILPRARYAERPLAAGDRVEVVHFVQGGRL
jgi:thiamine biosynthesis protein ThiS